ncbi:MAG: hypothetical protein K6F00_04555 [Lachnospiraceae bacterium]|nr:hypothetical protein [Lachnospiraceae bacterium]
MIKKLSGVILSAAMIFTGAFGIMPASEGEASTVNKVLSHNKTYSGYDLDGDGKGDSFFFYPQQEDPKKDNVCNGLFFCVMISGSSPQTISIDKKETGTFYYNYKTKNAKTVSEVRLIRPQGSKNYYFMVTYANKKGYLDTKFYSYKKGKVVKRRSKYSWREDKLNNVGTVSKTFKKSGLLNLEFKKVLGKKIKFEGKFKNQKFDSFSADIFYGLHDGKMVPVNENGKKNTSGIYGITDYILTQKIIDESGNKTKVKTKSPEAAKVYEETSIYADCELSEVIMDEADPSKELSLLPGDTVKFKKVYIDGNKTAYYVVSEKVSGWIAKLKQQTMDDQDAQTDITTTTDSAITTTDSVITVSEETNVVSGK